jgi:hypothetical protein
LLFLTSSPFYLSHYLSSFLYLSLHIFLPRSLVIFLATFLSLFLAQLLRSFLPIVIFWLHLVLCLLQAPTPTLPYLLLLQFALFKKNSITLKYHHNYLIGPMSF